MSFEVAARAFDDFTVQRNSGTEAGAAGRAGLGSSAYKLPCTVRQLQIFAAAAEDCCFARTAQRLGVSQPAITKQIAVLESRIGFRLFRRGRGVAPVLLDRGEEFLQHAHRFLAEGVAISTACEVDEAPARARVRIAAGAHTLADYIKPWLPRFAAANADVQVSCELVESSARGLELLERGAVDLLLYTTPRPKAAGFNCFVLRPMRLALYAGRDFAARQNAPSDEIGRLPFILPHEGSEEHATVCAALSEAGVWPVQAAFRSQYYDVIRQLAVDGLGVAALYETMAAEHMRRGDLVDLGVSLHTHYRMLYRRDRSPVGALAAVEASLLDVLRS